MSEGIVVVLLVAGLFVLVLGIWVIANYNRFVSVRNHMKESWSDIDVELKRRYDLIPSLVETCKGFAAHERGVFERVTELRNAAMSKQGAGGERAAGEQALQMGLGQLFAVVEAYPQLRSDAHFLSLQKELALTEDRIAASRRFYNANVREMRQLCEMFPTSILAGMFGFGLPDFFELSDAAERVVPRVDMT